MNALAMITALKKDLEETFDSFRFEDKKTRVAFYLQNEPRIIGENEENEPEPCQIVKLGNGSVSTGPDGNVAHAVVIIKCSDKSEERQGWQDVHNQIDRIITRYIRNPVFGGKYEVQKLNWMHADDDPYPICLGGVELEVKLPDIEVEGTEYD